MKPSSCALCLFINRLAGSFGDCRRLFPPASSVSFALLGVMAHEIAINMTQSVATLRHVVKYNLRPERS